MKKTLKDLGKWIEEHPSGEQIWIEEAGDGIKNIFLKLSPCPKDPRGAEMYALLKPLMKVINGHRPGSVYLCSREFAILLAKAYGAGKLGYPYLRKNILLLGPMDDPGELPDGYYFMRGDFAYAEGGESTFRMEVSEMPVEHDWGGWRQEWSFVSKREIVGYFYRQLKKKEIWL